MSAAPVIDFDVIDEHGPQEYRGRWDVSASELDRDEVASGGSVTIEARAVQGDVPGEYTAEGAVSFAADLSCSRCLDPYPIAASSPFHVTFRPRPEASGDNEEVEITASEELDVEFYSQRSVPLRDLALEQVQLSIPMKPLCDESCLGLCPRCGANRTREECSCQASAGDERWGALRDIRDELARKKDT